MLYLDWNGTPFDDTSATLKATNAVLKIRYSSHRPAHNAGEFLIPLIHFYERMGVTPDEYLARAEEEGEAYVKAYEGCYHECTIADGAFELWAGWKSAACTP